MPVPVHHDGIEVTMVRYRKDASIRSKPSHRQGADRDYFLNVFVFL